MSYFDDHNISQTVPTSQNSRSHHTLASAIDSLLSGSPDASIEAEVSRALQEINGDLAERLLEDLQSSGAKGVDDEVINALPRVPAKTIAEDQCPICTANYRDDPHPLVVKLPCSLKSGKIDHHFDLECIGPWLKVNSTCPLCRFDVRETDKLKREKLEREVKVAAAEEDDEEDDWDDNYG